MGLFSGIIGGAISLFTSKSKRKAEEARAKAEQERLRLENEEAERQRQFQLSQTKAQNEKFNTMMKYIPIGLGVLGILGVGGFMLKKK